MDQTASPSISAAPTARFQWPCIYASAAWAAAFVTVFVVLDQVDLIGLSGEPSISPWNLTLGMSVAALIRWPRAALPLVFLATVVSEVVGPHSPIPELKGAWEGLVTVGEAVAIVYCGGVLSRWSVHPLLKNPVLAMLAASLPCALVASIVQCGVFIALDLISYQFISRILARLWVGDVIGVFTITPLLFLNLFPSPRGYFSAARVVEVLVQATIVMTVVWVAFGVHPQTASRYFYVVFLPAIWTAIRYGCRGAILMNVFVQASMIFSLSLAGHEEVNITLFQALLLVLAVSGVTLGLAIDQNHAAALRLRAREEELAASLKVAATGELAGMLAHELGHPLGAISNYAAALNHLVRRVAPQDEEILKISHKLATEIGRATDTLHRLRDFYRTGSLAFEQANLSELINDTVQILKDRMAANSIVTSISLESAHNTIFCDRIQIRAVIHNLLANAIDALKAVRVQTRMLAITIKRVGEIVVLEIEDSGGGVAPDVRDHIFEPLVTTKKDGLGLGLSMSRSVVEAHGGFITLEESRLGGAKFTVGLPVDGA